VKILIFGHDVWCQRLKTKLDINDDIEIVIETIDNNSRNYESYDVVIPLHIDKILECITKKLNHKSLVCYDTNTIDILNNKFKFQNFMQKYFLNNILKVVGNNEFPFILKKNIGGYGFDSYIINNVEEFNRHNSKNHFCQEPIKGEYELSTHIIYNTTIKFIKTVKYKCEDSIFIKGLNYNKHCGGTLIDLEQKHVKVFDEILNKINFRGVCCFDYKIVDDKPIIFEINPRFGGGSTNLFPKEIIDAYVKEVLYDKR